MKKLFEQIMKFGVVGVIATLIDWGIFAVCTRVFHIHYAISNIIGFSISVIFNYWASVKWVFDVNKENDSKRNFMLFIIFSVIGLGLNELILFICIDKIHIMDLISKVIATAIVMVFNFVTRKKFLE